MEKSYYKSPIGILEIICENGKLVSVNKWGVGDFQTVWDFGKVGFIRAF